MKILALSILFISFVANASYWDGNNNPANMNANYQYRFDALPLKGRIDDKRMPWADNYWESDWGGISLRWMSLTETQLDPEEKEYVDKYYLFSYVPPTKQQVMKMSKEELKQLSPAEKYDILMGRYDYPTVYSERERTDPRMHDWQGICHGWVPAAINHIEPLPVEVMNPDGVMVPFGSTDVKALLSYYYGVTTYEYARGYRKIIRKGNQLQFLDQIDKHDSAKWLDVAKNATVFDYDSGYQVDVEEIADATTCTDEKCFSEKAIEATIDQLIGVTQVGVRPTKRGGGVRGLNDPNPGAFHVVMANQLGLMNKAFVGNINKKVRTAEIWNQPIVGFSSEITDEGSGRRGNWVDITTTLTYVTEIAQTWEPVVNTPKQRFAEITFSYTLELDESGNIVGGEWERGLHPSFIWNHDKLEFRGYLGKLKDIYRPRY